MGGGGAEAGNQSENDGGRAASDGGGGDPMDGSASATDAGGQQLDTGSSTSDGGARDTGPTPDANGCPANHFQTPGGCVPHFTSLSSNGDSVGGGTNCARRADNTVACWGRNISGQFGSGGEEQSVTRPVVISALAQAVEIAVGSNFVCHRRAEGTVFCSGANNEGALGRGVSGDSAVPVQVMGLTGAVELAAGYEHICARKTDGTVVCWGNNTGGQLGNGMSGQGMRELAPVAVTGLNNVVEIAAGVGHTCARRNASGVGSVVCWGANSSGQLGNGSTTSSPTFVQVTGLSNATALALGEWHSCALRADRTIACWGADGSGQLGNAENETSVPTAVVGVADALEVAANRFYTCARRMNGSVTCWGAWPGRSDGFGQVVKVESGALEIGAGYFHTCVRKSDGNVVCWGENRYGQIGDGMTTAVGGPYVVTPATVIAY
jgi:alpha-tubulin suppressor-like RCC1 family protein